MNKAGFTSDMGFPRQPDPAEIRRELDIILESQYFKSSKRCNDFLGFVVSHALDGDLESLKERTLAVQVFGRKADADLGDDSIVRVGAREVRKRLAQYYVAVGESDPVRIDLPAGSYVPAFHFHNATAHEPADPHAIATPDVPPAHAEAHDQHGNPPQHTGRRWRVAALAAITLAASASLLMWRQFHRPPEEFEAFWRPALHETTPVEVVMAHPIVYNPSDHLVALDAQLNPPASVPIQRPIHVDPKLQGSNDYVPLFDHYVGFGDSVAATRVSVLFATRGRPCSLSMASKLDFAEMRDSAAILIGAFTNRWTMELTQDWRFRFGYSDGKPAILDATSARKWLLAGNTDNGRATNDYVLIARAPNAQTGGFVVIGAGLTQYGTEEAGRIISDPKALVPILRKLPPEWQTKNLELVLHSRIMGGTPTSPDLLAVHTW